MTNNILDGKAVLVPRSIGHAKLLSDKIKEYGGNPIEVPLISFRPLPVRQDKIQQLKSFDWIILTSQNSVRFFFDLLKQYKLSRKFKVAVIGEKTAKALTKYGLKADFIPSSFVAEDFVKEFKTIVEKNTAILIPKGNLARSLIKDELVKVGCNVEEWIIYETFFPVESERKILDLFHSHIRLDILLFTSPSMVDHFMRVVLDNQLEKKLLNCTIACIGPITQKRIQAYQLPVHVCPENYTVDYLLEKLIQYIEKLNVAN